MLYQEISGVGLIRETGRFIEVAFMTFATLAALFWRRPPLAAFALLALACVANAQDSIRYTKGSVYSNIYQSCQIYMVVQFGSNVPPYGAGYVFVNTDGGNNFIPGLYAIPKTTPLGVPQNVVIPGYQTFNAAQYGGGAPYPSPYNSQYNWVAGSIYGFPTLTVSGGEVTHGKEWRETDVPASYVPGQTIPPVVKNFTYTVGTGAVANQAIFPVGLASNDGLAHTLTVKVNGTTVGTLTTTAGTRGGTYVVQIGKPVWGSAAVGDKYEYFVDGISEGGGTIPAGVFDGKTSWTAPNYTYTASFDGTPSTTPSSGSTNTGNTITQGPSAPSVDPNTGLVTPNPPEQTTLVNNGNTTIGGGTTGATNQDIYNDVYRALMDAGNNGTGFSNSSLTALNTWATNIYSPPSSTDGTPTGDDLKSMGTQIADSWQAIKDDMSAQKGAVDSLHDAAQGMIPSLGSVPSQTLQFSFAAPSALFGVDHFTLDASPYSDVIANFRLICSVAFGVLLFVSFVRYCRGALADL